MSFGIHEDDWGRLALEPEENRFDRARVAAEVAAFGEAHRAPGGIGWTDLMVVPPAPVELAVRGITLAALRAVLGPDAREASEVRTGYGGAFRELVASGFAFRCSAQPWWDTFYGCTRDGVVTQLCVTHATPAIADTLHRLGTAFRLVLCDLGADDAVIALAQRAAIDRYLADH